MEVLRRLVGGDPRSGRAGRRFPLGLLNLAAVVLLIMLLLSAWVPTADGPVSLLSLWGQQQPNQYIERLGNIEVMPVRFEGKSLFTLASPTVWDRSQPVQQLPVEVRVKQVEANLNRVIEGGFLQSAKDGILTNFDPKTLQVSVVSLNDVPVVVASDSYHLQPLSLVTVTYIDANYNAQPVAALAEQWRSLIYQNLYAALLERSPDALSLRGKLGESLLALAVMLGASLVIWLLQLPLHHRNRRLRLRATALVTERLSEPAAEPASGELASGELAAQGQLTRLMAQRQLYLAQCEPLQWLHDQRQVVGFFRWLLAWGQVFIWLAGLSLALGLFPWTRQALAGLAVPLRLLAIWFGTGLINRLTGILLHGLARTWIKFGTAAPQRDDLRLFTLVSALQPLKSSGIYIAGIAVALVYLGLPLSLVLCLGGVIGLVLLLICQSFVRDGMMGLLILWDDQYVIGDVIAVADQTGLVERMTLRLTQMQTAAGGFASMSHGSLTHVENLSRSWTNREASDLPPKPPVSSRPVESSGLAGSNPFGGSDPFNGSDPFGADSAEPTVTR